MDQLKQPKVYHAIKCSQITSLMVENELNFSNSIQRFLKVEEKFRETHL